MSTYTIRVVEGKVDDVFGKFYNINDVPEDMPVGANVRVYENCKTVYYKKTVDGFEKLETCPKKWVHLNLYSELNRMPERSYYIDSNGEKKYYQNEDKNICKYVDSEGKEKIFYRHEDFASNGGSLRDDFIRSINNTPITERGIPSDISESARKSFYSVEDDCNIGYDYTYATKTDLCNIYDIELKDLVTKLLERIHKDNTFELNQKLDFIMNHLKDSEDVYAKALKESKPNKKEDSDSYYDEDYYENSLDGIIDYGFEKLTALSIEIGHLDAYMDVYEIYDDDDIRIIYYLCS